jgi:hypothetical protein
VVALTTAIKSLIESIPKSPLTRAQEQVDQAGVLARAIIQATLGTGPW